VIALRAVGHVYDAGTVWAHRALAGVSLQISGGELLLVVGDNGSGKSTLAWILAGLIAPTEGSTTLDEAPIHEQRGTVAIAFQHARLQLFRPTVQSDIAFGTRATAEQVDIALQMVGLDPPAFRDRRIDELSGGEQRRIALAGLLVRRPRAIVFDEPLAGLDEPGRRLLAQVLSELPARTGAAVVVVSHDLEDSALLASRVIELREGRIVSDGVGSRA
jgi:energy-coupling factor transport system ATP-binding protein